MLFLRRGRVSCISVPKSGLISNGNQEIFVEHLLCAARGIEQQIKQTDFLFPGPSSLHRLLQDRCILRHIFSVTLSSGTHISTHSNGHSSICEITLLPNMNCGLLCLSEKFSYTDGLIIYLFFQLQQFCSNMLEEHQRLTVQAKLQTIKNENLKNKERSARIVAWLRKNT